MRQAITAVVTTLLVMGLLDAIWLSTMTARLYRRLLGPLLLDRPQWGPALAFYLLYAAGVLGLIVLPALQREWSLSRIGLTGALLGLVAYGTYDLTNQATLRGWSSVVTAVDMAWGAALTAIVGLVAVVAARWLGE